MKYNLKLMNYNPEMLSIADMFKAEHTPQGFDFWDGEDTKQINGEPLSKEALEALEDMRAQYEKDKGKRFNHA